jgi:Domain of unknown function (DUF4148)
MNRLTINLIAAAVIALPIASHAQSTGTVTRAQVRAELVQLEKAGYRPGNNDPHYPDDIQTAEARISAQRNTGPNVESSFGGVQDGSAASGRPTAVTGLGSLYAHP